MSFASRARQVLLGAVTLAVCVVSVVDAFGGSSFSVLHNQASCTSWSSRTALFSTPKRQPRRNLKKRRSRRDRDKYKISPNDFPWETAESRPLVPSKSIEAGEDYWIDEEDLKKSLEREEAIKNRKALEGEISKEKLREEIAAPYTQNWIGIISVGIVILATIGTQFPELLNQPVIPIPDL